LEDLDVVNHTQGLMTDLFDVGWVILVIVIAKISESFIKNCLFVFCCLSRTLSIF
jgi:hypothetical protein